MLLKTLLTALIEITDKCLSVCTHHHAVVYKMEGQWAKRPQIQIHWWILQTEEGWFPPPPPFQEVIRKSSPISLFSRKQLGHYETASGPDWVDSSSSAHSLQCIKTWNEGGFVHLEDRQTKPEEERKILMNWLWPLELWPVTRPASSDIC